MSLENLPRYLVLVLVIGGPLALLRPYRALVFAAFLLIYADNGPLALSRTTVLGPYFNALDATLCIALIAMAVDSVRTRQIVIPRPVKLILIILVIATAQSLYAFGYSYYTMRALRWALSFPLFFLIAANMVTDESRSRLLVLSVFLGAAIPALQNLFTERSLSGRYYYAYRGSIAAIRVQVHGLTPALLPIMPLADLPGGRILRWLYRISGGILLLALALTFTRSMWISTLIAFPIVLLIFRVQASQDLRLVKVLLLLLYIVVTASLLYSLILPELDIVRVLRQRIDSLIYEDLRFGATLDRMNALRYELDAWRSGTIILGRGISYFQSKYVYGTQVPIAYNHMGYATYLAQLGLVGLLIYGVYLPLSVLQNSRRLWLNSQGEATRFLGLLAGGVFVYLSIVFLMSGSLLSHAPAPGILAGAVWALSGPQALSGTSSEGHTSDNTETENEVVRRYAQ